MSDETDLKAAQDKYVADQRRAEELEIELEAVDEMLTADQAAIRAIQDKIAANKVLPTRGFWSDGPSVKNATALRKDLGIPDSALMVVRERTGVALGDPLFRETLPVGVNWKRAVEIDPRITDSHHYIDYDVAIRDHKADIIAMCEMAADPSVEYCEINSEGGIDKHAPHGYTLVQRQQGSIRFAIFTAKMLAKYAPNCKRIVSHIHGMWNSPTFGGADAWFNQELLDLLQGVGCDGYSKAYTGQLRTPQQMFAKPLSWITAKGLPMYITEYGVQEHKGTQSGIDGGVGKSTEFSAMGSYLDVTRSKDGGKTGIVHVMFNTDHDEPGAPDIAQWDPRTSTKSKAGFVVMLNNTARWAA